MTKFDISRTVATFALTALLSAACVLSAVGPAQPAAGKAAAAMAARLTA